MAGAIFIQAMEDAKEKGFPVACVVTNLAASMAMHILAHCDEKYILEGGFLLYHEARVPLRGFFSPSKLREIADSIDPVIHYLDSYLVKELGVSRKFYDKHNVAETLWSSSAFVKEHPKFELYEVQGLYIDESLLAPAFSPRGSMKKAKDVCSIKSGEFLFIVEGS